MASNYSYKNDYFGINNIISAIIAFFFGGIVGGIVRILEGNAVAGIIRIVSLFIGIGFILNIIDCVLILLNGKILRLL